MNRMGNDDLMVLLGAGASAEAGIPHSRGMIERLEELILGEKWRRYEPLYRCVKSAILFADGLKGSADEGRFNVERLVETLDELLKRDDHPLMPFVGAWNPKLMEVVGSDFGIVRSFRNAIVTELRDKWIPLDDVEAAEYYCGLLELQKEYQYPLRVFSLNYDLCLEQWCRRRTGRLPQLGFEGRKWNWRLLAETDADVTSEDDLIYLYKLHGSMNWRIDSSDRDSLTYTDNPSSIPLGELAVIFGTSYKLQYVDPFLFLAYEFRRWSLESRVIVALGYGFADPHVNEIIGHALRANKDRIVVSVSPNDGSSENEVRRIARALGMDGCRQIVHENMGAKSYLEEIGIQGVLRHLEYDGVGFEELT